MRWVADTREVTTILEELIAGLNEATYLSDPRVDNNTIYDDFAKVVKEK
jgi:hypothetical protein